MRFATTTIAKLALLVAQIGAVSATPAALEARQGALQPCGPGGACNTGFTCRFRLLPLSPGVRVADSPKYA